MISRSDITPFESTYEEYIDKQPWYFHVYRNVPDLALIYPV